jgi:hypothetical protein
MTTTTTTPTTTHRSVVALKLPTQVPALIALATSIVQGLTAAPAVFPSPVPPLATVSAAIADLAAAETAAAAKTRGAVAARNAKRSALVTLLDQLKSYVQQVADGDRTHAPANIQSAAMSVKKTPIRQKQTFGAKPGPVTGSVKLTAQSAGRRASYEWQTSIDGGKTWVAAPSSLQTKTTLLALTVGTVYSFRYRAVTKTGEGDWSQPVSMIVK